MSADEESMTNKLESIVRRQLDNLSTLVANQSTDISDPIKKIIDAIFVDQNKEASQAYDQDLPYKQDPFSRLTIYLELPEELVRLRVNGLITQEQFITDMTQLAADFQKIMYPSSSESIKIAHSECRELRNKITQIKGLDPWSQLDGSLRQMIDEAEKTQQNLPEEETAYTGALKQLQDKIQKTIESNKQQNATLLTHPKPDYFPIILRTIVKEIAYEKSKFFLPKRLNTAELTEAINTLSQVLDKPDDLILVEKLHHLENRLGGYSPQLKNALKIMAVAVAVAACVALAVFVPPTAPIMGYVLLAHMGVLPTITVGMIAMNVANGIAVHFSLKAMWAATQDRRYMAARQELDDVMKGYVEDEPVKPNEGVSDFQDVGAEQHDVNTAQEVMDGGSDISEQVSLDDDTLTEIVKNDNSSKKKVILELAQKMLVIFDTMKKTGEGEIGGKKVTPEALTKGLQIIKDALEDKEGALDKLEDIAEEIHKDATEDTFHYFVDPVIPRAYQKYAKATFLLAAATFVAGASFLRPSAVVSLALGVSMGFPSGHMAEYLKENGIRQLPSDIVAAMASFFKNAPSNAYNSLMLGVGCMASTVNFCSNSLFLKKEDHLQQDNSSIVNHEAKSRAFTAAYKTLMEPARTKENQLVEKTVLEQKEDQRVNFSRSSSLGAS